MFEKYENKEEVIIDVCDIDNNSLEILKTILKQIKIPKNFQINFKNTDFLLWNCKKQYDIVVGNPPYGKITKNKELLEKYKSEIINIDTNNIFHFLLKNH